MAGAGSFTRVGSGRNRGKLLNNAYYFAKLEKKPRKKRWKLGIQGSGGGRFGPPTSPPFPVYKPQAA